MSIEIEVDFRALERVLKAGPQVHLRLIRGVLKAAQYGAGQIRRTVMDMSTSGKGNLARSWKAELVTHDEMEISAEVFSNLIYARIQDQGGVITSKRPNGKLAIPIPGAGVPYGKWPRDYPKGKLVRHGSVLGTLGRSVFDFKPMFVLKSSVTIPPKHYIAAARKEAEPKMREIIQEAVNKALEEVGKI